MKKIIATLVLSLSILTTGIAQKKSKEQKTKMTPEQRTEHRIKKMTKKLNLSPEQVNQIKPIIEAQAAEHHKMREERKKRKEEERAEMKKNRLEKQQAFKNKMKNILSEEQYSKFEKQIAKKEAKMQKRLEKRKRRLEKKMKKRAKRKNKKLNKK